MDYKIGIVTALADESVHLRECFGIATCVHEDGAYAVSEYSFAGKSIYMVNSGVGEIAAALATQHLIYRYGVNCILNVGLVGSLCDEFKRGQLVAVNEIVHYEFTASYSDEQVEGIYIGHDSYILSADTSMLDAFLSISRLPLARIATGNKFVDATDLKNKLAVKFGCKICDMESAGIHFACINSGVPYVMIKCISDNADEDANESFTQAIDGGVRHYVDYVKTFIANI